MFATRALRLAAQHAERTPLIKFVGARHTAPSRVDHTPRPHPASPTGSLPRGFGQGTERNTHSSFSSYRISAQQHGPLSKNNTGVGGLIGGSSGSSLGPVAPARGVFFDRNELPERFRRRPLNFREIEAVESGGAALYG